ncbi:hypothetical protein [Magnetospira sp. QH-2]|uniref:DUF6980 family protein n=1 Tax=Magnetospira sp. (strain QH-2) TaxID=1288970 RepID=UPI0003E818B5|nr:hypothetical protein [Magnetospira sp. QH-2]CCQ74757.1 protein of unknown function [Magnetospira sp. QH-2]
MGLRLSDQSLELRTAVADPKVALDYGPSDRDYVVAHLEPGILPRRQFFPNTKWRYCRGVGMYFCPFTGVHLPGALRDARYIVYAREKGMDHLFPDYFLDARIGPRSMRTEQWWLERGIGEKIDCDGIYEDQEMPPKYPYDPYEKELPGFQRCLEQPVHFCRGVSSVLDDMRNMYWYLPHTREYGFRIIDPEQRVDFQPIRILPAPYCPWCGTRLPSSLRTQWEERVRNRGLDPDDLVASHPPPKGWPEELTTSAWWKNEGL